MVYASVLLPGSVIAFVDRCVKATLDGARTMLSASFPEPLRETMNQALREKSAGRARAQDRRVPGVHPDGGLTTNGISARPREWVDR